MTDSLFITIGGCTAAVVNPVLLQAGVVLTEQSARQGRDWGRAGADADGLVREKNCS